MKRLLAGLTAALLMVLLASTSVFAASPVSVQIDSTVAFSHLIDDYDMLVLTRYRLVPPTQAATDTFSTVTVTAGGDIDVPMVLTNRSLSTITVVEDSGPTDISSTCSVALDDQSITCVTTGLAAGTYDFTVTYTDGWDGYTNADAFYRLFDPDSTLVDERTVPALGYSLVGLYVPVTMTTDNFTGDGGTTDYTLTARHFYTDTTGISVTVADVSQTPVTDFVYDTTNNQVDFVVAPANLAAIVITFPYTGGMIWSDTSSSVELTGSPSLWETPSSENPSLADWTIAADKTATRSALTTELRAMLRNLEVVDPNVSPGDYVLATGITDVGQSVALNAFSRIATVIPSAFLTAVSNPWDEEYTTASSTYATSIDTDATATGVSKAFSLFGDQFGGPSGQTVGMTLFTILALVAATFMIKMTNPSSPALALMAAWMVIVVGWLLGGVPNAWVAITGGLLAGYGLHWILTRKFFA